MYVLSLPRYETLLYTPAIFLTCGIDDWMNRCDDDEEG
jgi:hypothetical protein